VSCAGLALGCVLAVAASAADDPAVKGAMVTIQGCVESSEHDSFVMTHVQRMSAPGSAAPADSVLGATGMEPERIYWLSNDSVRMMRDHVGHKVEVTGTVTDVSRGTVEIEKEAGKPNKVEVEARGKEAEAETHRPVEPGAPPAPRVKVEKKKDLPVSRVKVDSVKMLAATCP
jgi:hypothetical protein